MGNYRSACYINVFTAEIIAVHISYVTVLRDHRSACYVNVNIFSDRILEVHECYVNVFNASIIEVIVIM